MNISSHVTSHATSRGTASVFSEVFEALVRVPLVTARSSNLKMGSSRVGELVGEGRGTLWTNGRRTTSCDQGERGERETEIRSCMNTCLWMHDEEIWICYGHT